MARPRVFVSSTFYDLKHIRNALEEFIDTLGFEPILFEKGHIAFNPDIPLDESCYREVRDADIYVLVVGGRYGSERSGSRPAPENVQESDSHDFFKRYQSITREEYAAAAEKDIPTFVLIDRNVHAEYRTFQLNKNNNTTKYAYVDNVGVFETVELILSQPRNNPIHEFDSFADITGWLREQWSGLFKEMLARRKTQARLSDISTEVERLSELTTTLKSYIETVVRKLDPDHGQAVVTQETARLDDRLVSVTLRQNPVVQHLLATHKKTIEEVKAALLDAANLQDFCSRIGVKCLSVVSQGAVTALNIVREAMKKPLFEYDQKLANEAPKPPIPPPFSFTFQAQSPPQA